MYGREYMGIERSTFLINPDGIVEQEWRKVKVKNHIEEVLQTIRVEAQVLSKVYFTFEPREDLRKDLIESFQEVDFNFTNGLDEEKLENAEVLVTYGEDLKAEHLLGATHLKWIFVASAGVEKMPAQAIANLGIVVSNVRVLWFPSCR